MDETTNTDEIIDPGVDETYHQLGKIVLGTVAGFVAGRLVNAAYDAAVQSRRQRKLANNTTED